MGDSFREADGVCRHLKAALQSGYKGARISVELRQAGDLFFLNARALSPLDRLPPRAREIAKHFARGLSHKEIARLLEISPATVRNHLQEVYRKLGVSDKAELATLLPSRSNRRARLIHLHY